MYLNRWNINEKTFDEFIEGLDFSKGYVTFQKSYSYVGKGGFRFQHDYHEFVNHRKEFEKRGYHMIELNESDNFFRDDLVTYIYKPDNIGAFRLKKFESNLHWFILGSIPLAIIIGVIAFHIFK